MSIDTQAGVVPEWDLADRMRKSLRVAGVGVQEMAEYLDVSRNTVSTWINGRITPSTQTVRLWAMRTGVPYVWLTTGVGPEGDGGGAAVPPAGFEPATKRLEGSRSAAGSWGRVTPLRERRTNPLSRPAAEPERRAA